MKIIGFVFCVVVLVFSCKKDKANELITEVVDDTALSYCDTVTISFSSQILPIFDVNCSTSNCHNAAAAASGYVYETYSQLSDDNNINPALKTMKHDPSVSAMPKFQSQLPDSLIQQIECWIQQGKLNN